MIAFYSYSLGILNATTDNIDNYNIMKSDKDFCFSTFYGNLFNNILQKESSAYNYNNITISYIELSYNKLLTVIKIINDIFDCKIIQYIHFSKDFLFQFSKNVIIFPFNYFW